jgi:hypothetical protein
MHHFLSLFKPPPAAIQFIKEGSVQESVEVVGTEEYPIDNRFGDKEFTTEREVSRESTNELSVDTSSNLGEGSASKCFQQLRPRLTRRLRDRSARKSAKK